MKIENIDPKKLKPAEYNPRKISPEMLAKMRIGLQEYGLQQPIVINKDNTIIGGHQRVAAAIEEDHKTVPCVRVDIEKDKEKAFNVFMNKVTGDWELEGLAEMFESMDFTKIDDVLTGYDRNEIDEIISQYKEPEEGNTDPDDTPEDVETRTKTGDIWELGDHVLMCGDCTSEKDVDTLLGSTQCEMMFTDPPYGVDYKGGHFNPNRKSIENDTTTEIYNDFLRNTSPYIIGPCYMWFAGSKGLDVYKSVHANNFEIHALIVWHKINATYAAMNAQYKQRHEPCLYFKPKGSTLRWCGASTESTLWEIKRDSQNTLHPTQKPVALAEKAIGNHNAKTVADFFCGSGSTIIAAERLGRKCYAMEIEPHYCDVAIQRWENYTGREAVLLD